jgi:hypothetical protein
MLILIYREFSGLKFLGTFFANHRSGMKFNNPLKRQQYSKGTLLRVLIKSQNLQSRQPGYSQMAPGMGGRENAMSRDIFKSLMDLWVKEPDFREKMRQAPEETLNHYGFNLDEDEMVALRSLVMF